MFIYMQVFINSIDDEGKNTVKYYPKVNKKEINCQINNKSKVLNKRKHKGS